jgi:hypothetical protein
MTQRQWIVLVVISATACARGNGTTTSPSPTPTAATFSLSGQAIDSTAGTGISGATVRIVGGPSSGRTATTDASGNYSFSDLEPSAFTVRISATDYATQFTSVTLTSNQTLSFRLNTPGPRIVLTGRVIDSTSAAPIPGAAVSINGRYASSTDSSGNYSVAGFLDAGLNTDFTYISANNYESDYRYIRGTSHSVRLYPIRRMTAGDSTVVTIAPDDTLCVNNAQDSPGLGQDYVCRSVRVVAPSDGVMTVAALSTQDGTRPPLEMETLNVSPCCSERMDNPLSIQVSAGTEVVVNVEMLLGSTTSQSFMLTTSMAPR